MSESGIVFLSDRFGDLSQEIANDELEICRARARVQALTGPFEYLVEGENFALDRKKPSFTGLSDGQVTCTASLQVAGTYRDGRFHWGFRHSAIPEQASGEVRAICEELDLLEPLLKEERFSCSLEFAEQLSHWLALQMFWTGAAVVPQRESDELNCIILLMAPGAASDQCTSGEPVVPPMWCSYCGTDDRQAAKLFRAAPTCCICTECVRRFKEVLGSQEEAETDPLSVFAEVDADKVPCLLCGAKTPRIFEERGAVCHSCLRHPAFDMPSSTE